MKVPELAKNNYHERVLPSPISLLWVLLVFPISYLTFLPIQESVGTALGVFLSVAILVSIYFASPVIEFDGQYLAVGSAQIPLEVIKTAEFIAQEDAFEARGVKLSPAAYTRFQGSVKELVRVNLDDPQDPTPYWLFSTRNAKALTGQINLAVKQAKKN